MKSVAVIFGAALAIVAGVPITVVAVAFFVVAAGVVLLR